MGRASKLAKELLVELLGMNGSDDLNAVMATKPGEGQNLLASLRILAASKPDSDDGRVVGVDPEAFIMGHRLVRRGC